MVEKHGCMNFHRWNLKVLYTDTRIDGARQVSFDKARFSGKRGEDMALEPTRRNVITLTSEDQANIERAKDAFWKAIRIAYPGAASGDLSPGDVLAWDGVCDQIVKGWLTDNVFGCKRCREEDFGPIHTSDGRRVRSMDGRFNCGDIVLYTVFPYDGKYLAVAHYDHAATFGMSRAFFDREQVSSTIEWDMMDSCRIIVRR